MISSLPWRTINLSTRSSQLGSATPYNDHRSYERSKALLERTPSGRACPRCQSMGPCIKRKRTHHQGVGRRQIDKSPEPDFHHRQAWRLVLAGSSVKLLKDLSIEAFRAKYELLREQWNVRCDSIAYKRFIIARRYCHKDELMPVKIESFEPFSDEEFNALRQQKGRATDPAMVALLTEVDAGQPEIGRASCRERV